MLAFVEGSMERKFINTNFKYVHVIPVQNGITWTAERICQQICSAYKAYDAKTEVVVWLDREGRECSASQMRQLIIDGLIEAGADEGEIHVLVNDRMSENIILADKLAIMDELSYEEYDYCYEGQNGKSIIKRMFRAQGRFYSEMKDGVLLLKKLRLSNAAQCSPCVAAFLGTFQRDCWWI